MQKTVKTIIGAILLLFTVGCAQPDWKVDLTYERIVNSGGGRGDIFIARPQDLTNLVRKSSGEWIIGETKGFLGEKYNDVVTQNNVDDWIVGALRQELSFAGYNVNLVTELPAGVAKGINLTIFKVLANHTAGAFKAGSISDIQFKVEICKNGVMAKSFNVTAAGDERTLVSGSAKNPGLALRKALQVGMQQAVPEIIKTLEQ